MSSLTGKNIIVAVTGSIAAYKSADLVRRLQDAGAEIRVVMTKSACEFITPLTLQTLSGHPVAIELLDADQESAMGHITLARWADWIVIAPASANTIARLAQGRSDDLLSALCLATESPLVVCP
ncbi:MAG: bifunctional 4'-phosphopantothenoylcysteine decarboxylase/phosphopantothenoylcysteine synthetase, partial [Proteobacteria bacterium]|nr:bifunctional 4'-phosphopantothenoylcysteine decarboxylase/phosphopantothenoylcysteine synthetase [Pseudomonadota bacterium]